MKSNQKLSLLFWVKKTKVSKKDGKAPLYVRITIDCQDQELSTGCKINPNFWDVDLKKDLESGVEAKKTNSKIDHIKVDLERHFTVLQSLHERITPAMLKNVFKGLPALSEIGVIKKEEVTLLDAMDNFIENFEKKVNKKLRSKQTLNHWRTTRAKVADFISWNFKQSDLPLSRMAYAFGEKFFDYMTLEVEEPLAEVTAKKHAMKVKQIVAKAYRDELIARNPLEGFTCEGESPEVEPLELSQVEAIYLKKLTVKRLEEVRDAFIFQCFTGFAFQDVYGLSKENLLKVGIEGEEWLIRTRGKTNVNEIVPVLPIVRDILDKYKSHPYCIKKGCLLPINCNGRYNAYLKEVGDLCGITRELNTHLARHTFADIMLNNGAPLEDVQKMLGHKSIRTTQKYAKVRKARISSNMKAVRSELFTKRGKLKRVA